MRKRYSHPSPVRTGAGDTAPTARAAANSARYAVGSFTAAAAARRHTRTARTRCVIRKIHRRIPSTEVTLLAGAGAGGEGCILIVLYGAGFVCWHFCAFIAAALANLAVYTHLYTRPLAITYSIQSSRESASKGSRVPKSASCAAPFIKLQQAWCAERVRPLQTRLVTTHFPTSVCDTDNELRISPVRAVLPDRRLPLAAAASSARPRPPRPPAIRAPVPRAR